MMNSSRIKDLTGKKFGMLTPVRIVGHKPLRWECVCDCGNIHVVTANNLRNGSTISCGCAHRRGNPKHNQCYTRVYRIYAKIKRRCLVKNDPAYPSYGGRGIHMCDEWLNSFDAFSEWAYSNGYDDSLTIDRIDNDGDYCPENCRWASVKTQNNNQRRNVKYTYMGETKTLASWCEKMNISYGRTWWRINSGWSFEEAVNYKSDARIEKRKKGD